ncbi:MAG: helix-turn-helix domain-containing protein [Clostridia bacterium]|nr:helix-turn-helix domain-containing protein [Clostridia bacterium]
MVVSFPAQDVRGERLIYGHLQADVHCSSALPADGNDIDNGKEGGTPGASPDVPPVVYLGWPLYLSPIEYRLLVTLLRAASDADIPDAGWVSPAGLGAALACPDSPFIGRRDGIPEGQVAVHVLRINRKAAAIGGRRLIVSRKGMGYRINPYM